MTLLSIALPAFPSDGWVEVRLSARQSRRINFDWLFLGCALPRPSTGLSLWTFFHQTSLRLTWPCHLSRWVRSTSSRSSSCVLTRRSYELTWSLVVTPHMQQIIAQSFRCMQALQISGSWDQGFHYMEHGAPGARIVNFYFKVMEDEKAKMNGSSLNLPHATQHFAMDGN